LLDYPPLTGNFQSPSRSHSAPSEYPSFTLISIAITWLIALGLIFGIPALRTHQNRWPPSVQEFFIDGYIFKFLLFGLIHSMLMVVVLYADETRYGVMQGIGYALFFTGAAINFVLRFRAVTLKNANPYLVPVLFAAPVFFGTAPTVSLLWFGGGAVGSLAARRRTGDCLLVGTAEAPPPGPPRIEAISRYTVRFPAGPDSKK
jgi:hypothetical protein